MRKGFTLIELLIVIAIIAILALIALPNFLEAQIRAKVSRVKSDLRSLGTGIEAYLVDYQVIMGSNDVNTITGLPVDLAREVAYSLLTTPIAYITTAPSDPFLVTKDTNIRLSLYEFRTCFGFTTGTWANLKLRGFRWAVNSIGPYVVRDTGDPAMNAVLNATSPAAQTFVYDPTNGTKSKGFIIRTNKGEYTGSL